MSDMERLNAIFDGLAPILRKELRKEYGTRVVLVSEPPTRKDGDIGARYGLSMESASMLADPAWTDAVIAAECMLSAVYIHAKANPGKWAVSTSVEPDVCSLMLTPA
jgi:hypothetical protein